MRKTILVIALLCYTLTSAFAQKLTLTNSSCNNVFIKLYADDNSGCGPASIDESDAIYLAAGSSIVYNFTGTIGTSSVVGANFVWMSTGTSGTPSATLSGPPSTFNFFKADVWSSCATLPITVGATCNSVQVDGVTIYNPSCSSSASLQYVNTIPCGTCDWCGSYGPCWPCGIGMCCPVGVANPITSTFSTSGSDWFVTVN